MKKHWLLASGMVLLAAGLIFSRLDIGSPATGNILIYLGIGLAVWNFLRHGPG